MTAEKEVSKTTQNMQILEHLMQGKSITQYDALRLYRTMRLASRISDLRRAGHKIEKKMIAVTNGDGEKCRVAQYWMEAQDEMR